VSLADPEGTPIVWMAGATMAMGDSVYYYSSWDTSDPGTMTGNLYTYAYDTTYKIGYTVPSTQTYLGGSYYMQGTFPLKYLRPANGFPLKMKEGVTVNVPYTDSEGTPLNWSYTDYSFWLENTGWMNKDGTNDNDIATLDTDKGDIAQDKLMNMNFYDWDSASENYVETKAYVLETTEQSPVGWNFDTSAQSIVTGVKTNLEALYLTIPTGLSADLTTEANAIVAMPAISSFPTY
jgi:hypothetical protein